MGVVFGFMGGLLDGFGNSALYQADGKRNGFARRHVPGFERSNRPQFSRLAMGNPDRPNLFEERGSN